MNNKWWLATDAGLDDDERAPGAVCVFRGEPTKSRSGAWQAARPGGYWVVSLRPNRFAECFLGIPIPEPGKCREVTLSLCELGALDPATVEACLTAVRAVFDAWQSTANENHVGYMPNRMYRNVEQAIRNLTKGEDDEQRTLDGP